MLIWSLCVNLGRMLEAAQCLVYRRCVEVCEDLSNPRCDGCVSRYVRAMGGDGSYGSEHRES